jgi:hypothetical protein
VIPIRAEIRGYIDRRERIRDPYCASELSARDERFTLCREPHGWIGLLAA